MAQPSWISKLKERWNLSSAWQVVVILLVFACTGFTVLFLKAPLLQVITPENGESMLAAVLYYLFILPIYNILLLMYGFIFGQFKFFWDFEKRFIRRIFSIFKKN